MTDIDSSDINKFIHKAVLNKENIFNAYKNYCETRGNVDYVDFEWKYYQLYHENREERSPLTFSDLPMDILEKVIGKLSLVDRLILRDVSHDLRNLADSTEAYCEKMDFYFGYANYRIKFENVKIEYENGNRWIIIYNPSQFKTMKLKKNQNCKQAVIDDAATILKNPKLRIGHIRFNVRGDKFMTTFFELLRSLNIQLNVRSIDFDSAHSMVALLQIVNPDKLEEITSPITFIEFNRIAEANCAILKNPKLKFDRVVFTRYSDGSLAKLLEYLKSINSHHNFRSVSIRDEKWISPVLSFLKPETVEELMFDTLTFSADQFDEIAGMEQWRRKTRLEWCRLPEYGLEHFLNFKTFQSDQFDINDEKLVTIRDNLFKSHHLKTFGLVSLAYDRPIHAIYEQLDRIMSQNPAYDVETRRMSIPNSCDYFQLECDTILGRLLLEITRISNS